MYNVYTVRAHTIAVVPVCDFRLNKRLATYVYRIYIYIYIVVNVPCPNLPATKEKKEND